jgi:CheY-like chemotaxis protein
LASWICSLLVIDLEVFRDVSGKWIGKFLQCNESFLLVCNFNEGLAQCKLVGIRVERLKLKRWLEELRCEVIEASNGNEGLDLYHAHRPELVITDIIMPEKDGIQMMAALQRKYPDVKVFAISGAGVRKPGEYLHFTKGVALHTFAKPIDKGVLLAAVVDLFPEADPNLSP